MVELRRRRLSRKDAFRFEPDKTAPEGEGKATFTHQRKQEFKFSFTPDLLFMLISHKCLTFDSPAAAQHVVGDHLGASSQRGDASPYARLGLVGVDFDPERCSNHHFPHKPPTLNLSVT